MSTTNSSSFLVSLIPTIASPQIFSISLANASGVANTYNMTITYRNATQGGWFLDLADVNNNPIITGIPLVVGIDLLAQYAYLGLGGSLVVNSVGGYDDSAMPLFNELGSTANLYWVTASG